MRCLISTIVAATGLAVILPAQTEPEVQLLELNGRLIRYQVRGGFAIVEGDLIIGTAEAAEAARRASTAKSPEPQASVLLFDTANPEKWRRAPHHPHTDPSL